MSEDVPMQYVVVRDPDLQEIAAGAATATRTTSTTLFVTDVNDDNKLLEEIVVKFGVESVSNPTQRALRWDEITKTFNSLSLTLSGKTMTKDQVRRKWNNMKKVARKKWESDDPAVHKRETPNLENSATFEIIRQEEDTVGGSSTTTIVVLDQTEKYKAKVAPSSQVENDARSFFSDKGRDRSVGRESDEDDEEEDVEADDRVKRRRVKKRKIAEQDREYREAEEHFGPHEEIQAKKRLRWEKRLRNAEASFHKKKNEIEAKIKDYESDLNQIMRLNNELQQRILEKKIALEIEEEEIAKVDQILERAGSLEIFG